MSSTRHWLGYGAAVVAVATSSLIGFVMSGRFDIVNIAMVYLLGVVIVSFQFPRGPAVLTALLSVIAFDVLFVPPQGMLRVEDAQYLLTFAIMLAVGLIISSLVNNIRRQAADQAKLKIETETERVRSALLMSLSHDLRTPLAVITGASSTLAEDGERIAPSERSALAKSIYDQSKNMAQHFTNVLQMARLETQSIAIERDWVAIPEVVGAVLDRFRERLSQHRVILDVPKDLPLVRVNAMLIEQVLGNLVDNAAKHTPEGTIVRVRVQRMGDELVVSVEDFSQGLPPGDLERLFAKFERGSDAGAKSGMGLGLAICRAIMRLHHGKIWAERIPGAGTAFRFTLPIEEAPPVPDENHLG